MTKTMTVDEQVNVIRDATAKAMKSKASALKFLQDAGIVPKASKSVRVPNASASKK